MFREEIVKGAIEDLGEVIQMAKIVVCRVPWTFHLTDEADGNVELIRQIGLGEAKSLPSFLDLFDHIFVYFGKFFRRIA